MTKRSPVKDLIVLLNKGFYVAFEGCSVFVAINTWDVCGFHYHVFTDEEGAETFGLDGDGFGEGFEGEGFEEFVATF